MLEPGVQELARQRPGVLAVPEQDLAVHDGVVDALCQLAHAPAVGREVVDDVFLPRGDSVRIEDDQVCPHPLADRAAAGETNRLESSLRFRERTTSHFFDRRSGLARIVLGTSESIAGSVYGTIVVMSAIAGR